MVPLALDGVFQVTPSRFADARGWFEETYNAARFQAASLTYAFVQDNQSYSKSAGTVRGIHFQRAPHAQAKLVRVVVGAVFDVAVDLRAGSPMFGQWVGAELSAENGAQLLIPRGFGHGFVTRTDGAIVAYKVDGFYDKASEGGVHFSDSALGIDWGVAPERAILSAKDQALPPLDALGEGLR